MDAKKPTKKNKPCDECVLKDFFIEVKNSEVIYRRGDIQNIYE